MFPLSAAAVLALGGDGLAGDSAAIAAISLVSIAAGYALLAALWYFVFRQKPEERERDRAGGQQAPAPDRGTVPSPDGDPSAGSRAQSPNHAHAPPAPGLRRHRR